MIGTTLRHYVIKSPLGRGGMGEVWLARDTTLDRDVALKILPPDTSGDAATRKERFFREAKAASALNHPNIVTIHEINHDQGFDFIAMEYVEGATLASLLRPGMPIAEIEKYATQIAAAVGRAHRANIVHRDLKPGNIMVTNDGLVKVLDFGLAKALQAPAAATAETVEAAPSPDLTREGMTLGTVGYMSPEQSVGDFVDARSDVFSFGVIFYEMLAGRRPFDGKTRSDMLQQLHLSEPSPLGQLRPDTPVRLHEIVMRCLQKKPGDRFSTLTEVHAALAGGTTTTTDFVSGISAAPHTGACRSRLESRLASRPSRSPACCSRARGGCGREMPGRLRQAPRIRASSPARPRHCSRDPIARRTPTTPSRSSSGPSPTIRIRRSPTRTCRPPISASTPPIPMCSG